MSPPRLQLSGLPLRAARVAVLLWAVTLLLLCGTLASRHLLPLPVAVFDSRLQAAVRGLQRPGAVLTWSAYHVIYLDCACSRRVLDHLLTRGTPFSSLTSGAAGPAPAAPLVEHLLLIDDAPLPSPLATTLAAQARARGFIVHALSPADLQARFGLEASPLLLVSDPAGQIRYLGGYTPRKRGPDPRDLAILRDLIAGRPVTALPIFGCATSDRLRAAADPLRLRALSADL